MRRHGTTLRQPANRFYWTRVESPAWRRHGQLPLGMQAELADDFPEPIEQLHIVGVPDQDGCLIVCAAPVFTLNELIDGEVSLLAEGPPACLGARLEEDGIELLVGDYEPKQLRRARLIRHGIGAAAVVACALLVAFGLSRRSAHWESAADAMRAARLEVSEQIAPGTPYGALKFEVARLQAVAAERRNQTRDASITLESLLRRWPLESSVSTGSILVTDASVSVVVSLEGDASPFLRSIRPPEGWELDDPRLNTLGGRTRLTLVMKPMEGHDS